MAKCQKCNKPFKNIDDIHLIVIAGGKMGFPVCIDCKQKHYPQAKELGD